MKLIHLSDLHLGKRVNGFSMLKDQEYILDEILSIIDVECPDAVLIAGDVYDKSIPPAEAVDLLDFFLVELVKRELPVFIISGNHDSADRLSFTSQLIKRSKVYISTKYTGVVSPITLEDKYGPVNFFLLPFIKPVHVRQAFPGLCIENYTDAVAVAIAHMPINPEHRNVLVTHQFVAGAARCESEEISVGGSDSVAHSVFAPFDYVALGHIHGPQNIKDSRIRYSGSPLKYSFSETKHRKSATIVELGAKGALVVRQIPFTPLRDMIELKGSYNELTARAFYEDLDTNAYVHITLTDEQDVPDAISKLRIVYPNLMRLDYDNNRTRAYGNILKAGDAVQQSPLDLFKSFYQQQNNASLSVQQEEYLTQMIENVWGQQ